MIKISGGDKADSIEATSIAHFAGRHAVVYPRASLVSPKAYRALRSRRMVVHGFAKLFITAAIKCLL